MPVSTQIPNHSASSQSGMADVPPGLKVSLKNTFINVDDELSTELIMPDLLRAQTTPAVYDALQALYNSASKESNCYNPWQPQMDALVEAVALQAANGGCQLETDEVAPPPAFDAEEMLRQISELTETLSLMNYEGGSSQETSQTMVGGVLNTTTPSIDHQNMSVDESSFPTTVMLRNIPNKYTADKLLEQFAVHGFTTKDIDFFYLPIDFRNKCNVGYAFINFRTHERALSFSCEFENYRLPATNSAKVCTACWARIQGREPNVTHYRDSPILPDYRPWLFDTLGMKEPFPEPDDPAILEAISKSKTEALRASNATKGPDEHKIFVGGLDRTISGEDLVKHFSRFGPVKDAAIVIDRTSGKSRGFGFCLFERYVPRDVLATTHIINGCEVAVKLYDQPANNSPNGAKQRTDNRR